MTRPADYRIPATDAPGHIYTSRNSLAWNRVTAGQGHTVNLGGRRIPGEQQATITVRRPEVGEAGTTTVLAVAAAPLAYSLAWVAQELARPARQEPPIYARLMAASGGLPEMPDQAIRDGQAPTHADPTFLVRPLDHTGAQEAAS